MEVFDPVSREAWRTPPACWDEPGPVEAVGLAASAGGLPALVKILTALPGDFPAPIFLANHRAGDTAPFLSFMRKHTRLRVREAASAEVPAAATVYIAPYGRQLAVLADGRLCVCGTERVRHCRPSADLLFESLARCFSARAVAVVLSGMGRDGAVGVRAIRHAGGYVIVQSPRTAQYPAMPAAALETRKVDFPLPPEQIAFALTVLAAQN